MTSFIFPGQGSQFVGMAKDFHDNFSIAKSKFEEIEDFTSLNIRRIIFENEFPSAEIIAKEYIKTALAGVGKPLKNFDVDFLVL